LVFLVEVLEGILFASRYGIEQSTVLLLCCTV
jgi:hypothetical protein